MRKLLVALMSAGLILTGANAFADDTMMKKDAGTNLSMDKDIKKIGMVSPIAMSGHKKARNKKHHKHQMKKGLMKKDDSGNVGMRNEEVNA